MEVMALLVVIRTMCHTMLITRLHACEAFKEALRYAFDKSIPVAS